MGGSQIRPRPSVQLSALLAVSVVAAMDAVLRHPTRVRIYQHLVLLPGDHFRAVLRAASIGVGEGQHHLRVLIRNGLVREEKSDGRRRYYPAGSAYDSAQNALYEKHWRYRDLRLRVLLIARQSSVVRPSAVASVLGISRQLAAYHLARLEEVGLVSRDGKAYRATPDPEGQRLR